MTERFAIYFAPDRGSELWRLGSEWLGRDAAARITVAQPAFKKIDPAEFLEMTASPRRYGFHATIKPPMHLAAGVDSERLRAVARALTARLSAAIIGPLEVCLLDGFLALIPARQKSSVTRLAADCVSYFEPMRAPLVQEERTNRMKTGLTEEQLQLLDQYGYPYVMDQFRMHMTLTGRLEKDRQKRYLSAARKFFAPVLDRDWMLNAISIYCEPAPGEPFERLDDFPFSGNA